MTGSPYTLDIVDSSLVTLSGEGLSLVPVDQATTFTIHTKGAGSANISVDITGELLAPSGGKMLCLRVKTHLRCVALGFMLFENVWFQCHLR